MADRVEVDPDQLDVAADLTQDLADQVHRIGNRLRERLGNIENESTKQPWGDDSMGNDFINGENGNGYGASRVNLLDGVDGIGDTFDNFAIGQRDGAAHLRSADSEF